MQTNIETYCLAKNVPAQATSSCTSIARVTGLLAGLGQHRPHSMLNKILP